jgi:hypothetical protein
VAREFELHIICDNYSIHKHAKVTAWLKRHPRFHIHFIPTSSSWLHLVERFFGEITAKVIRSGSFRASQPWSQTSFAFSIITISIPKPTAGRQNPSRTAFSLDFDTTPRNRPLTTQIPEMNKLAQLLVRVRPRLS